jgi:hypothetical protein
MDDNSTTEEEKSEKDLEERRYRCTPPTNLHKFELFVNECTDKVFFSKDKGQICILIIIFIKNLFEF